MNEPWKFIKEVYSFKDLPIDEIPEACLPPPPINLTPGATLYPAPAFDRSTA